MKKSIILVLAMCIAAFAMAQNEEQSDDQELNTIFSGKKITHGGYGGMSVNYSQLGGRDALLVGARGAWIINHGIGIGIGGYGITNDIRSDLYGDGSQFQLAGGYGGLLIEPIIAAKSPVHVSLPVIIGAGGIAYVYSPWASAGSQYENAYTLDADAFFVVEPGVELELNMVRFFRISLGAYYRYTSDVALTYYKYAIDGAHELVTENPDLKGFSFGLTLKFGKF